MPVKLRDGSGCFLKHADGRIKRQASRGGIILILRLFSAPCTKLFYGREFKNQSAVTRSVTHLQRIYRNRLRYPHHPRTSRSQRCFNHYGLHPRPQPRRSRRSKPYRPNVICFSLFSEDRPNLAVNDVFRLTLWKKDLISYIVTV